ncbi:helix-turn-helix domain-containing protein [Methylobacterium sp. 1030]|uniref:helix-turn-helix domain-containing protein n=1 Tax=Methylobacterium sp. 1030 TaxID=3156404 RepID=UPI00339565B7
METLIDTSQVEPRYSFDYWQAVTSKRIMPLEQKKLGKKPFEGKVEAADVGLIQISRVARSALRSEATPNLVRQYLNNDHVLAALVLSGSQSGQQSGREYIQNRGEFVVLSNDPSIGQTSTSSRVIYIKIPRGPLERVLGPVSLYSGLTMQRGQPSLLLMANYIKSLVRVHSSLTSAAAERASSTVIDLVISSVAERIGQEPPGPIAGTLLVQRAKAYVEANLGDPTLDPSQLALAMGISLRRLQQLFQRHNQNISDWIWRRRIEAAASRLSDPASVFVQIGVLAYQHGFVSQAHFSSRFKEHYGLSPRDYRQRACAK